MAVDKVAEMPRIFPTAQAHGIDPCLILAIRCAENGGPGREFGVLSRSAPTYDMQLEICCNTIQNLIASFGVNPFIKSLVANNQMRLIYNKHLIEFIGRHYAPIAADNDPTGLNQNWIDNVYSLYLQFHQKGVG